MPSVGKSPGAARPHHENHVFSDRGRRQLPTNSSRSAAALECLLTPNPVFRIISDSLTTGPNDSLSTPPDIIAGFGDTRHR